MQIRTFTSEDAEVLAGWIDGPDALRLWSGSAFTWPLDKGQMAAYVAESATPLRRTWSAEDCVNQDLIGHASLRIAPDRSTGRLGRVLIAPRARGKGYSSVMLNEVLGEAFDAICLERVDLSVFRDNAVAVHLYEHLGFTPDRGTIDAEQTNSNEWAAVAMSIDRNEWDARGRRGAQL